MVDKIVIFVVTDTFESPESFPCAPGQKNLI